MHYNDQRITRPLYELLPIVFVLAGIALLIQSSNTAVLMFAVFSMGYGIYISFLRLVARDSIHVDCRDEVIVQRRRRRTCKHRVDCCISSPNLCQLTAHCPLLPSGGRPSFTQVAFPGHGRGRLARQENAALC